MKSTRRITEREREAIIAEYLMGETSYRQLGVKLGVDYRVLHSWVTKFVGRPVKKSKQPSTIHHSLGRCGFAIRTIL